MVGSNGESRWGGGGERFTGKMHNIPFQELKWLEREPLSFLFLFGGGGRFFYCISSDFSDFPNMTVEYIDLSVLHASCFSLSLLFLTYTKVLYK